MKKLVPMLSSATALAVLCSAATAEDQKRPGPRGPEMMLKRLDQNQDGKVTADEIPEAAPEFVKGLLKRADKNADKTVTAEEFRAAISQFGPGRGPGPGPASTHGRRPGPGPEAQPRRPSPDRSSAGRPKRPGPTAGPPTHRGPHPGAGHRPRPQRPLPDPKVVFQHMDRDKDGKLSLEEFTAGMKAVHERRMPQRRPATVQRPGQGPPPWARAAQARAARMPAPRAPQARAPQAQAARARAARAMAMQARVAHARPPMRRPGGPTAMKRPPMGPEAMMGRIKAADKNKDGKLSKKEAPELLKRQK